MEYQKITNLLVSIPDKVPRFITKKWLEVHDQSGGAYNNNEQIRFKTSMLRSDLCDYSDAYIVVKGFVTVKAPTSEDRKNRTLAIKNNAPFISSISKINGVLVKNAEDLDVVMPMYNLLKYSKNYSKTSGSLWNYHRDEITDEEPDANGPNKDIADSKSFKYKAGIYNVFICMLYLWKYNGSIYNAARRITNANGNEINNPYYDGNKSGTKEVEISVRLKYIGNFWSS